MSGRAFRVAVLVAAIVPATLFLSAAPSSAAFPGVNGRIAWDRDLQTILTIEPDGTHKRVLTDGQNPTWSPDGEQIAFDRRVHGVATIYVMNADGTGLQRLTRGRESYQPTWSPDGEHLAFVLQDRGDPDIAVMDDDGGDLARITHNVVFDGQPAWSPKGDQIAYVRVGSGDAEIFLMDPDGENKVAVTKNTTEDNAPSWAPDGERIAFTSFEDGDAEIFVMNADGSGRQQLTHNTTSDGDPAFSPNGNKIAFDKRAANFTNSAIWVMSSNGDDQTRLVGTPHFDINPDWGTR